MMDEKRKDTARLSSSEKEASNMEGTEKVLDKRTTLLRPPEPDQNKAPIENTVEVTPLAVLGEVRQVRTRTKRERERERR